jgi:hypothetical protein
MTRTRDTAAERVQVRRDRNPSAAKAKVFENVQAGLGVSSVIVGGAVIWYIWDSSGALQAPVIVLGVAIGAGMIWFGALSVLRFSLDEVRDMVQWLRLQEKAVTLQVENDQLRHELADARRELKRANALARTQEFEQASKGAREVVPADDKFAATRRNVEAILNRWSQGLPYGRDHVNMTEGDWKGAMDALEAAGVAGRGGPGGRQRVVLADNLTHAQQAVEKKLTVWEKYKDTNFTPA